MNCPKCKVGDLLVEVPLTQYCEFEISDSVIDITGYGDQSELETPRNDQITCTNCESGFTLDDLIHTDPTFKVTSSHGEFTIDQNGRVMEFQSECDCECRKYHCELEAITRFDLDEWHQYWRDEIASGDKDSESIDIVDLGYWFTTQYSKGESHSFEEPEHEWRLEIKNRIAGKDSES